jgi:hypothetical protein
MNNSTPRSDEIPPWIGVDLDGTLAVNEFTVESPLHIGPPVPAMLERVKRWIKDGKTVRIFTARVAMDTDGYSVPRIREAIANWCLLHVGQELEATHMKDYAMVEIWDDRAISVETNTGRYVRMINGKAKQK